MLGRSFIQSAFKTARNVVLNIAGGDTVLDKTDILHLAGGVLLINNKDSLLPLRHNELKRVAIMLEGRMNLLEVSALQCNVSAGAFIDSMDKIVHALRDQSATSFDPARGYPVPTQSLRAAIDNRHGLHNVILELTERNQKDPLEYIKILPFGYMSRALLDIAIKNNIDFIPTTADTMLEAGLPKRKTPFTDAVEYEQELAYGSKRFKAAHSALMPAAPIPSV